MNKMFTGILLVSVTTLTNAFAAEDTLAPWGAWIKPPPIVGTLKPKEAA